MRDNVLLDDLRIASGLIGQGRWARARPIVRDVLADAPDSAHAWCLLATCHLAAEEWLDTLTAADRALALAPTDEWAYRLRAFALRGLGRHDAAVVAAECAVTLAPANWAAQMTLADVLLARRASGDVRAAYQAARTAQDLAPDQAAVHWEVGLVLAIAGDMRGATRAHRRALALDPTHRPAATGVALADAHRGRVVRAARALHAAWRTSPDHPAYRQAAGVLAVMALFVLAVPGSLLSLLSGAWAGDPRPVVRLGVGLPALLGYLTWCGVLAARLLHIEPRLPALARGRFAALSGPLLASAVLVNFLILLLAAVWPAFPSSALSSVVGIPVMVLVLAVEVPLVVAVRGAVRRARWRRSLRTPGRFG